jgi:hypothetical protein
MAERTMDAGGAMQLRSYDISVKNKAKITTMNPTIGALFGQS